MGLDIKNGLSTGEKVDLVNRLSSIGYVEVMDTQTPHRLQFTSSSSSSDPLNPDDSVSWSLKIGPR